MRPRDKTIRQFYLECLHECQESSRRIKKDWDTQLDQYLCLKDFSKKKDWQFKIYTPISKPVIKRATYIIRNSLTTAKDYFDFDTPVINDSDPLHATLKKRANFTKRLVRAHLDADNFLSKVTMAIEAGFALGLMVFKVWPSTESEVHLDIVRDVIKKRRRVKLKLKAVNPLLFDFSLDGAIQIEHDWLYLPDLFELAKTGYIDMRLVKKLYAGDYSDETDRTYEDNDRLEKLGIRKAPNKYRKLVKVSHYWGPYYSKENRTIMKHCHFIIANDKYVLKPPSPNPYYDNSTPYIYTSPIKVMFRHIGKGLTQDVAQLEDAIVDFVNLQADNLLWNMLGIREIDIMAVDSKYKKDIHNLHPGKLLIKRTGFQGDTFKYTELGTDPNRAMPLLQELKTFHENDHGITEYIQGLPTSVQTTKGQYLGQQQQSLSLFQSIAKDVENDFLVPIYEKAKDRIYQFMIGNTDPNAERILGEEGLAIDILTPEQIKELVLDDYSIIGKGVSSFFYRLEQLNKLGSYVKMINAMPDQAKMRINYKELLLRLNSAFGFDDEDKLLLSDEEFAVLQQQLAQANQQQMQMEIQKLMAPIQAKLEQTRQRVMADLQKAKLDFESEEKDRQLRLIEAIIKTKQKPLRGADTA